MDNLSKHLTNDELIGDVDFYLGMKMSLIDACRKTSDDAMKCGECISVKDVKNLYSGTINKKEEKKTVENNSDKPLNNFIVDRSALRYDAYTQSELQSLADDIKENGQQVPVSLWFDQERGKKVIVDGNHRQKACNMAGVTLRHATLKNVKRHQLDKVLLSTQLKRRGMSAVHCNCECFLYLHHKLEQRITAKKLSDRFELVDKKQLSYLKIIYTIRPLWFKTLRAGKKVVLEDGLHTDNVRRLYDLCKEEERATQDSGNENDKSCGDNDAEKGFTDTTLDMFRPMAQVAYKQHKSRSAIAAACEIVKAEWE